MKQASPKCVASAAIVDSGTFRLPLTLHEGGQVKEGHGIAVDRYAVQKRRTILGGKCMVGNTNWLGAVDEAAEFAVRAALWAPINTTKKNSRSQ